MSIKSPKIALVCDFLEERWPSMDVVASSLLQEFSNRYRERLRVHELRPSFVTRFGPFPGCNPDRKASIADRLLNRFFDYPRFLKSVQRKFDLFHIVDHSYSHLVTVVGAHSSVVTCHDLDSFRCLTHKQNGFRQWMLRRFAHRVLAGFQRAEAVMCDSSTVRDMVTDCGLVTRERLSVNPIGVTPCFRPDADPKADAEVVHLLGKKKINQIEILHVGSTIPRKRIDFLLYSFAEVKREFPSARLIRVGGAFTSGQCELMNTLGLPPDAVAVLPFLKREVLAGVYRRASLVLLPSESEGFGLPALEALACGTPVVVSDLPVLREVAGEAATYCPVGDLGAWSQTILNLLQERSRPRMVRDRRTAGIAWAAQFTWAKHADRSASLYRKLLGLGF